MKNVSLLSISMQSQLAITSNSVPKSGTLPSDINHSMYKDTLPSLIITSANVIDVVLRVSVESLKQLNYLKMQSYSNLNI
jgi:hypothetical protein